MKEISSKPFWKIQDEVVMRVAGMGKVRISKSMGQYRSEDKMGDRVLFQVFNNPLTNREASPKEQNKNAQFGPVIYGHWCGSESTHICKRIKKRMVGRNQDVEYTSARLVQEIVASDPDDSKKANTGFGIWNADTLLTKEDSHGDAGIILVDVSEPEMRFLCMGGYLEVGKDSFPVTKTEKEEINE